jgi:hypothetical protein
MKLKNTLIFILVLSFSALYSNISAQNSRADGYKGLWSVSLLPRESGIRFSGGAATYSSQHNPVAIFSPAAGKTFFVYGGTSERNKSHLQIMVSYFDHKTLMVPKPVIVFDKEGVDDPQDNATISIDSTGYIYVFISGMGRTRPGYIFKSSLPYSIDRFNLLLEGEIVFPQPWWIKDSCFVMLHTKFLRGRELFCSTGKDGKSWSPAKKIAGMGGHNLVTESDGRCVYSVFNYFPGGNPDRQTNLYLIKSDNAGKSWKTVDNKLIQLPLNDIHNDALIRDYESEKKLIYIKNVSLDANGDPVILILVSNDYRPGPTGDPREWIIVHRQDNKWIFTTVCQLFSNYDMGSIYIKGKEWRIIGSTEPGTIKYAMGGEMAVWISYDEGNSWKKSFDITTQSSKNNSFARRPVNANKMFYSFWTDGDPEKQSECRLYFTDESCKKVWVLPYDMTKDQEKPKRLRK